MELTNHSQVLSAANHALSVAIALKQSQDQFTDAFELDVISKIQGRRANTLSHFASGVLASMVREIATHHCEFRYSWGGRLITSAEAGHLVPPSQLMYIPAAWVWTGSDFAFTPWVCSDSLVQKAIDAGAVVVYTDTP